MALHVLIAGDPRILWVEGGLFLGDGAGGLLLDAPDGAGRALAEAGLFPDVVAFSSGRLAAFCGLPGLVAAAVEADRTAPLRLWSLLGEERSARLVEGVQGPGLPFPLIVDADPPGASFAAGPWEVRTAAVRRGESDAGALRAVPAVGFRASGPLEVAWVPGSGPGARALCDGADLAVIEVGVRPWPTHPERWRFTVDEAVTAGRGARRIVLAGDDGRLIPLASD